MLLGLLIGANGCARHYNIVLTNGNVYTAVGKPKYDKATGAYTFKDSKGRVSTVPGFRVKEIAAPGMEEKVDFGPVQTSPRPRGTNLKQ
jgi:hypothetical protein